MATQETIVLQNGKFTVSGGDGEGFGGDVQELVNAIHKYTVTGFDELPLPKNNLVWKVESGNLTICILELEPALRRMSTLAPDSPLPYGPEATYQPRKLATPYVVMKVTFLHERIQSRVELFYRNAPLRSRDDKLYWSNLMNVSPHAYDCYAWVCTQYLRAERTPPGIAVGLDTLLHHLWGGGFNLSSEHHEGNSCWSKAVKEKVDPRVIDMDRWERESIANPRFVLDVNWKPVGVTVRQLIEKELNKAKSARNLGKTSEIVNVLTASRQPQPIPGLGLSTAASILAKIKAKKKAKK